MKEFTYSQARQRLAELLEAARRDGAVRIRRPDGQIFVLRPDRTSNSPLDVRGLQLSISREEIVAAVREGRRDPWSSKRAPSAANAERGTGEEG